jgi:hypothetical protein
MASERFCRDCRNSRGEGVRMTCDAPANSVAHKDEAKYLVTGEAQPLVMAQRGANCVALRMRRPPEIEATVCGPSGAWFEEKAQ